MHLARSDLSRASVLVDRNNRLVQLTPGKTSKHEEPVILTKELSSTDSMLATIADPQRAPEMLAVRESIRGWRFYEGFRTDSASPVRIPQVGTFTPVLNNDGTDLPAALETIRLFGDREALNRTVEDAFPGSHVQVDEQAADSKCGCASMGSCDHSPLRSYRTGRCVICCGRRLC